MDKIKDVIESSIEVDINKTSEYGVEWERVVKELKAMGVMAILDKWGGFGRFEVMRIAEAADDEIRRIAQRRERGLTVSKRVDIWGQKVIEMARKKARYGKAKRAEIDGEWVINQLIAEDIWPTVEEMMVIKGRVKLPNEERDRLTVEVGKVIQEIEREEKRKLTRREKMVVRGREMIKMGLVHSPVKYKGDQCNDKGRLFSGND